MSFTNISAYFVSQKKYNLFTPDATTNPLGLTLQGDAALSKGLPGGLELPITTIKGVGFTENDSLILSGDASPPSWCDITFSSTGIDSALTQTLVNGDPKYQRWTRTDTSLAAVVFEESEYSPTVEFSADIGCGGCALGGKILEVTTYTAGDYIYLTVTVPQSIIDDIETDFPVATFSGAHLVEFFYWDGVAPYCPPTPPTPWTGREPIQINGQTGGMYNKVQLATEFEVYFRIPLTHSDPEFRIHIQLVNINNPNSVAGVTWIYDTVCVTWDNDTRTVSVEDFN